MAELGARPLSMNAKTQVDIVHLLLSRPKIGHPKPGQHRPELVNIGQGVVGLVQSWSQWWEPVGPNPTSAEIGQRRPVMTFWTLSDPRCKVVEGAA